MQLKRNYYRSIFYDFKVGLSQEEYLQSTQLAYGNEAPSRTTVVRSFAKCRNFHFDWRN